MLKAKHGSWLVVAAMIGFAATATAQLTAVDEQAMNTYLDTLSTAWDQSSVNGANAIVINQNYTETAWATYFQNYFQLHSLTSQLYMYLHYPTFYWFDDSVHTKLQAALNPIAIKAITTAFQKHNTDLGVFLAVAPENIDQLAAWLHFIWDIGTQASASTDRHGNFVWLKSLIAENPTWLSTSAYIDPAQQPYANYVRMQVVGNLRDTLDLTMAVQSEIAAVLALNGERLQLWTTRQILIHDNQFLKAPDYAFLRTFWDAVPSSLSLPGNLSVNDALGNTGTRTEPFFSKSSINVFAIHVGDQRENEFPDEVPAFYSDLFALVAIHETNHVIDAASVMTNVPLRAQRDALLRDAGTDHLNYLRSQLPDGFFVSSPQEFCASMSNEYVANTPLTCDLAMQRWRAARHQPVEQLLFFMNVYSGGTDSSRGYILDERPTLNAFPIPLERDGQHRIVAFTLPAARYTVTYGPDAHVLAFTRHEARRRSARH